MTATAVLWGADGRMGRAIADEAAAFGVELLGGASLAGWTPVPGRVDVVVDFSSPAGALDAIAYAASCGAALVSGTTGVDDGYFAALTEASTAIPVLHAANTSLGVWVLRALVEAAARALPASFDVEIVEAHHRRKVDAPSGTALLLEQAARDGRASLGARIDGRSGHVGARVPGEVGMHAVRGGDVVGDHAVMFLGDGERVELAHRATDRRVFARGALQAATWIVGRPAGRYSMNDVLGLAAGAS
jgi:4-hydroxy-tetrahydrodipicolinate reductase